tara:strand:+ start:947 stop:1309 length:363 start_codon:yes stop_codon:yes gene_type:complete
MKVLYRLGFYLAGLSFGLIFLAFFLNGKKTSCNYTPNARVIDNLLQKEIIFSNEIKQKQPNLTREKIKEFIKIGKVNFSKSDVKKDSCKKYHIEINTSDSGFFEVINCAKTLNIISFSKP